MQSIKTLLAACLIAAGTSAQAVDLERSDIADFVDTLVREDGLERSAVEAALADAKVRQDIIERMQKPAEKRLIWGEYRDIFLTDKRIDAGVNFWDEHAATVAAVSDDTGVPPEILLGIIGVETYYGRITGKDRVIDALVTLGFDYPPRAAFFRKELRKFFELATRERIDIGTALGSYAGAMGRAQFIASSYLAYAVDTDGDGRRDLFNSWPDVVGSVANYFVSHRWKPGSTVVVPATLAPNHTVNLPERQGRKTNTTVAELRAAGVSFDAELPASAPALLIAFEGKVGPEYYVGLHNFYVITEYNHSAMYAMAVWQLGNAIAEQRASRLAAR
ncbi:MAG: lytic murein transglycosylase B [Pseudomonadota bacterium]